MAMSFHRLCPRDFSGEFPVDFVTGDMASKIIHYSSV